MLDLGTDISGENIIFPEVLPSAGEVRKGALRELRGRPGGRNASDESPAAECL